MAPSKNSSWRWMALAALVPLLLFLTAVLFEPLWAWLGFGHLVPHYADLVAILAAGQASQAGLDVYAFPNPFDPFGRPHVYGPWWLITGRFGLEVGDAWWMGTLLLLSFLVAGAAVLRPRDWKNALWSAGFLASPPIMLGLERGNNDLIIVLLLAAAAWFISRKQSWGVGTGAAIVALAAGLKIYPLAAAPMLLARADRWRSIVVVIGAGMVWWLIYGAGWSEGLRRAVAAAPEPETIFAHGVAIIGYTWRVLSSTRGWFVLAGALAAVLVVYLLGGEWRRLWHAVPIESGRGVFFAAGALPWIFCFVATTNFPYRIVLLLLPARLWLAQRSDPEFSRAARMQLGLWLAVAWLLVPKYWAVALLQNETNSSLLWVTLIAAIEQGLIAMLTVALSWSLLGWLVRQLRAHLPARNGESVT